MPYHFKHAGQHSCEAVVLSCIDFRFWSAIVEHIQNELKITGVVKNDFVKGVIDRTFYDSDKTRWIIDYKINSHEGADLQGFLNREQLRYQLQLGQYKQLMQQIDPRPVKLALYFPMMRSWRVC